MAHKSSDPYRHFPFRIISKNMNSLIRCIPTTENKQWLQVATTRGDNQPSPLTACLIAVVVDFSFIVKIL